MTKEQVYQALGMKYGYLPDDIANMPPSTQYMMLGIGDPETISFATMDDYLKWMARRHGK